MGLKTNRLRTDIDLLSIKMAQVGDRSERAILSVMREEAEEIKELAQAFSPVDEGSLEQAIEVVEDREGINRRTQVSVRVDEDALDDTGRRVGKYAKEVHEGMAPYGSGAFNLGPNSRNKDGGSGQVGGKFMDRAVLARMGIIKRRVRAVYERIFG